MKKIFSVIILFIAVSSIGTSDFTNDFLNQSIDPSSSVSTNYVASPWEELPPLVNDPSKL